MKKNGKDACDWCGRVFRRHTPIVKYTNGECYHYNCLKKVGGRTDMCHKRISPTQFSDLKKQGYISKGRDGVERGLFLTKKGTTLIPIKVSGDDKSNYVFEDELF